MRSKLILASANSGKLRELAEMLAPLGYDLVSQTALGITSAEETGSTFEQNALLKARHAALQARAPALADDSGIEVAALGGRPGVYSARYAGADASDRQNLDKLLQELQRTPADMRGARYRCVIAFVRHADDSEPLIAEGTWEGRILEAPRGSGGFGYDPIFQPEGCELSAAELDPRAKNRVSHRGKALQELLAQLQCLS